MQGLLAIVFSTDVAVVKFHIYGGVNAGFRDPNSRRVFRYFEFRNLPIKTKGKIRMRRITLLHMYDLAESITLSLVKDMHRRYWDDCNDKKHHLEA